MLASHEQELEALTEQMEVDRRRQLMNMRDRMASAKRRKMDNLRRKQEAELTKEALTQKKEIDEIRNKKVGHCAIRSYRCASAMHKNRKSEKIVGKPIKLVHNIKLDKNWNSDKTGKRHC